MKKVFIVVGCSGHLHVRVFVCALTPPSSAPQRGWGRHGVQLHRLPVNRRDEARGNARLCRQWNAPEIYPLNAHNATEMPGWKKNIPACLQADQEGGMKSSALIVCTSVVSVARCVIVMVSRFVCYTVTVDVWREMFRTFGALLYQLFLGDYWIER